VQTEGRAGATARAGEVIIYNILIFNKIIFPESVGCRTYTLGGMHLIRTRGVHWGISYGCVGCTGVSHNDEWGTLGYVSRTIEFQPHTMHAVGMHCIGLYNSDDDVGYINVLLYNM